MYWLIMISDDNDIITLHFVPCVCLTLNCCSFPVSAHVSVPAASRLPLQLFGTPFLWPFVVVSPLTVFGANSKTFFYGVTLAGQVDWTAVVRHGN